MSRTQEQVFNHGPDDLMDIPIEELVHKLVRRLGRLKRFRQINAPLKVIEKEKQLVRIAEIAARVRVREINTLAYRLLNAEFHRGQR